jgi:hypothetical protein
MPARKPEFVICATSFVGSLKGRLVEVHEGEVLPADDPIARHWSAFFKEPAATARGIEQATAAPGETRGS